MLYSTEIYVLFLNLEGINRDCQVEKIEHFQHLLHFAFNQGSKTAKAARYICAEHGGVP